jgi:hypothetical protein
METGAQFKIVGHVHAIDQDTKEVLIDKKNAIHPQNMARVIARGLAHEANSYVLKMGLGNGGTHINTSLQITYLTPNVSGTEATLYNGTYEEQIDDQTAGTPSTNSVISAASPAPAITSIVTCTMELDATEPNGQAVSDGITTNPDSTFTFDELGLYSPDGLLLSHIVFNPIEKTANRSILITYTLTISVS